VLEIQGIIELSNEQKQTSLNIWNITIHSFEMDYILLIYHYNWFGYDKMN